MLLTFPDPHFLLKFVLSTHNVSRAFQYTIQNKHSTTNTLVTHVIDRSVLYILTAVYVRGSGYVNFRTVINLVFLVPHRWFVKVNWTQLSFIMNVLIYSHHKYALNVQSCSAEITFHWQEDYHEEPYRVRERSGVASMYCLGYLAIIDGCGTYGKNECGDVVRPTRRPAPMSSNSGRHLKHGRLLHNNFSH